MLVKYGNSIMRENLIHLIELYSPYDCINVETPLT